MIFSIVGCGNTAKNWQETRCDVSIGVNDCRKFGHDPDYLVIIDSPNRFTKERIETIKSTKSKIITRDDKWKGIIGESEKVRLQQFGKHLKKGHVYCSKTSTFVAMSLAFNMGATDIILHGVDLNNHAVFKPGNKLYDYEIRQYEKFIRMLNEYGIKVWVSSPESALSKFLPIFFWVDMNAKPNIHEYNGPIRTSPDMEVIVERAGMNQDDIDIAINIFKK